MNKKSITWIELINENIKKARAAGKKAGVMDVMSDARTEWKKIKSGTHPAYVHGKPTGRKHKGSKHKSRKNSKKHKMQMGGEEPAQEEQVGGRKSRRTKKNTKGRKVNKKRKSRKYH